jgi:AcrR family transcriptional regulator
MSPRTADREEREDQILDSAEDVFAEKGVHQARMDDIVAKSGLSKGTLYWYFKSKDDILIAIFERLFKREFEEIAKIGEMPGPASERLKSITDRTIKDSEKMLRLMPIAYEFMSLAFRRKFVQDAFKHYINRYMDILVPIIQDGIDRGEFRANAARDIAIAIGAIFEGTILLWVYDNNLVDIDKHFHSGITLLLEGIQV